MRQKVQKLIVTFHTTADAMACEAACKNSGVPGRLIPVPRSVSAGCGIAWCTDPEERERLSLFFDKERITFQEMRECPV